MSEEALRKAWTAWFATASYPTCASAFEAGYRAALAAPPAVEVAPQEPGWVRRPNWDLPIVDAPAAPVPRAELKQELVRLLKIEHAIYEFLDDNSDGEEGLVAVPKGDVWLTKLDELVPKEHPEHEHDYEAEAERLLAAPRAQPVAQPENCTSLADYIAEAERNPEDAAALKAARTQFAQWRATQSAAPVAARDARDEEIGYLRWRLETIIPLFEEARDALTAIPLASAKLRGIDLSLGDRMDRAGTATRTDYAAIRALTSKDIQEGGG